MRTDTNEFSMHRVDPADHTICPGASKQQQDVARIVVALPREQRTALLLRRIDQLGYAEIAVRLHLPENEVRAGVYDALRSLRMQVGDRL